MSTLTGMFAGIPFTDCAEAFDSLEVNNSYGTQEFWHGTSKIRLFTQTEIGVSASMSLRHSTGIAVPNLGGSDQLDSVVWRQSEKTTAPATVPRNPGEEIDDEVRLLMVCAASVRWLGIEHAYTISGQGTPVFGAANQGTRPGLKTITSAQGIFSLTIPADAKIEKVGRSQTNDGNVHKWNAELYAWTPNSGDTSSPILTLPADLLALLPAGARITQITQTMNGNLEQPVKVDYATTVHPTS